ncbi:MAG: histidine phosphatase family protein, partial [Oscillospiraceae bacterium]
MTTVYLIRHAEAFGNINEVFQGRTDLEVTDRGYKQLDQLAERFREVRLDAIYSSPLKRTIATATAVNRFHNLEIIKLDGIIEINGGVFEGRPWPELPVRFPEAFDLWKNHHHEFTVEGGESMKEVYDRMKET